MKNYQIFIINKAKYSTIDDNKIFILLAQYLNQGKVIIGLMENLNLTKS